MEQATVLRACGQPRDEKAQQGHSSAFFNARQDVAGLKGEGLWHTTAANEVNKLMQTHTGATNLHMRRRALQGGAKHAGPHSHGWIHINWCLRLSGLAVACSAGVARGGLTSRTLLHAVRQAERGHVPEVIRRGGHVNLQIIFQQRVHHLAPVIHNHQLYGVAGNGVSTRAGPVADQAGAAQRTRAQVHTA